MNIPKPPYLGAAYYPEAWPAELVDEDIRLMLEAGLNVARIGEFAWSSMEPEEGRYAFDWLHGVVDQLGAAGIAVILGTPTATPPAWLAERYPEILAVDDAGARAQHGSRRHVCPNSPVYREHCARIAARMGDEFGRDSRVIGWQIDNEVHPWKGRGCFCPVCVEGFRKRLRDKFGSLHALNEAWCARLWSQTYSSFEQVPAPRTDIWHHPALLTEWMLFQGDSQVAYVAAQAAVLRERVDQPIGTDMMPTNGVNYRDMHRTLDLVQYNHYDSMDTLWRQVFWMDFARPVKPRPWWNTETATCWNGSTAANGYKDPGFCRANSWLPVALGAEANLYWLWRAHRAGQELMHGAVVSSCGRPLHMFAEVREIADGFAAAGEFLRETRPADPGLAVHFSGHAWWLFEFQPMVNGFRYIDALLTRFYRPLMETHLRADVIDPAAPLDPYKLVCSPFLPALDEAGARERLRAWIEAGGVWVAGPLTDVRDLDAGKYTQAPFGCLEDWAGVHCVASVPGDPRDFALRWSDGQEGSGSLWYDGLDPRAAQPLATYDEGPFRSLAAVTETRIGKGRLVLLGTLPSAGDLAALLLRLAREAGVTPAAQASPNILAVPREGPGGRGMVAVEFENRPGVLTLPEPATDLLSGTELHGEVRLTPYQALVLKY